MWEYKTLPFEIKATSDDGSTGDGLAGVFFNIDSYKDIVAPGAFLQDLPKFVSDGFFAGLNHDWDNPIGVITEAKEVPAGLNVAWKISATKHGEDVKILLKDKVVRKLSFAYSTLGYEWLETEESVRAFWAKYSYTPTAQDNARVRNGGVRLLTRVEVYEASPTVFPANDQATINTVKNARFLSVRDLESYLCEEGGLSKSAAKYHAGVIYRGSTGGRPEAGKDNAPTVNAHTNADMLRIRLEMERRTSKG